MRLLVLALLVLVACDPEPVGRRCDLGTTPDSFETVITSASLDCPSRLCLQPAGAEHALCTAACERDADCIGDPSTTCTSGFACAVVTSVGEFADEPMCVCRDDLAR